MYLPDRPDCVPPLGFEVKISVTEKNSFLQHWSIKKKKLSDFVGSLETIFKDYTQNRSPSSCSPAT